MEMQSEGFQFLEDIATGAWFGEILFRQWRKDSFLWTGQKNRITVSLLSRL